MSDSENGHAPPTSGGPKWIADLAKSHPQTPLVLPFMTFLVLMTADRLLDESLRTYSYALRTFGSLYVVWLFRHHFPKLGKLHLHIAIPFGLITAVMWVEVHHFFAGCSAQPCEHLRLFGFSTFFQGFDWYRQYLCWDCNPDTYFVPGKHYESTAALWAFLIIRIGGASTAVPIVEELFWRGFALRLFINWDRFEKVPLGTFTLWSFVATSLLSAVQHQPQWEVGIICWMMYNALFYWKRSLACNMVTHGVTNLALYIYVYNAGDWRFW